MLATASIWLIPVGAQRGAVVLIVLLAALSVSVARRWVAPSPGLPLGAAIAAAVAMQVLFRADSLLPATLDRPSILGLAVPVVVAGAAIWWLGRRGPRSALVAAAAAVVVAGGVTATVAASLVALAAALEVAGSGAQPWRTRRGFLALATLLAVALWSPRLGVLAAGGAALLCLPAGTALAVVSAAVAVGLALPAPGAETGRALWLALLTLPAALLPRLLPVTFVAGGLLLTVAGALLLPGRVGLVLPLALLAFHLPLRLPATRAQAGWLALLLLATAILASYPWLDGDALLRAVELLGVPLAAAALGIAATILGLASLAARAPRRALAAAALVTALVTGKAAAPYAGGGEELLAGVPFTLNAQTASWEHELDLRGPVRRVLVDSTMSNSLALEAGTVVATVVLESPQAPDGVAARWTLRAGEGTGEWAVRRAPGRGAQPAPPAAWTTWVAPPGRHFGQWYRASWELRDPVAGASTVRVEREPHLPPEVTVSLIRLELRP